MRMLRFGLVCLIATLMGTSSGRAENLECSCLCSNGVYALCIIDHGDDMLGGLVIGVEDLKPDVFTCP
jgi:hypothetical protein